MLRRYVEELSALSPPPVVMTWPITSLSGWGTAGRAIVKVGRSKLKPLKPVQLKLKAREFSS